MWCLRIEGVYVSLWATKMNTRDSVDKCEVLPSKTSRIIEYKTIYIYNVHEYNILHIYAILWLRPRATASARSASPPQPRRVPMGAGVAGVASGAPAGPAELRKLRQQAAQCQELGLAQASCHGALQICTGFSSSVDKLILLDLWCGFQTLY